MLVHAPAALCLALSLITSEESDVVEPARDPASGAQHFCLEAEDFTSGGGWRETPLGQFAGLPNMWSRNKMMAAETDEPAEAVQRIVVREAGRYRLWVHCELSYGFGQVFGIRIRQGGRLLFDERYGRIEEPAYFPFGRGLTVMAPWHWHSTELAYVGGETVDLQEGLAEVIIHKGRNQQPAAPRVLDFVFLSSDLSLEPGSGPWSWRGDNASEVAPIISRFRKPFWFKVVVDGVPDEPIRLAVAPRWFVNGYYKGPRDVFDLTRGGFVRREGPWWRVEPGPDAAPIEQPMQSPWQRFDAATIEMAAFRVHADRELDGGVRLMVADAEPCDRHVIIDARWPAGRDRLEVVCATGVGLYEDGSLAGRKAMTYDELFHRQADIVKRYPVAGRPPRFFGALAGRVETEYPGYLRLYQAMGLNGQYYGVDPALYLPENARRLGTRREMAYVSLSNAHINRQCLEGDFTDYAERCREMHARHQEAGVGDIPVSVKMIEESGPPPLSELREWPKINEAFRGYLQGRGIEPAEVLPDDVAAQGAEAPEAELWGRVTLGEGTAEEAADNPALYYHSVRFRAWLFAEATRRGVAEIQRAFPEGSRGNAGSIYPSEGNGPVLGRGVHPFELFRVAEGLAFHSEISWGRCGAPQYLGPQTQSYEGALGRALAKYHDVPMGTYQIAAGIRGYTDPEYLHLATFVELAHGFEHVTYYDIRMNCGSTSILTPIVLKTLKSVNHAIGQVEDDLTGVRARVVPARVALGWSITTDVWDLTIEQEDDRLLGHQIYPQERQQLYYLLRHCQVPVDILGEQDVAEGRLRDYDAYVLVGDHLSRAAAEGLAAWVRDGGTVISVAGGGLLDEYNRPNPVMAELFGVASAPVQKADICLRPKLELLHRHPLDAAHFPDVEIDHYGFRQTLTSAAGSDVEVLATTDEGRPAAIARRAGDGRAILLGFLPGYAYVRPAFPMWPFGRGGEQELSGYLPTEFAAEVREVFRSLLDEAGVVSPVVCSEPLVEAVLLIGDDGLRRICLLNFTFSPVEGLEVTLNGLSPRRVVDVATGDELALTDGRIRLDLDRFAVLRLE
ncbi:MAG: hypothetical protein U9R79_17085 [Armatimonadota bacterium]|nr:hypothetical protein [Armatimonadota bacterium]